MYAIAERIIVVEELSTWLEVVRREDIIGHEHGRNLDDHVIVMGVVAEELDQGCRGSHRTILIDFTPKRIEVWDQLRTIRTVNARGPVFLRRLAGRLVWADRFGGAAREFTS